MENWQVKENDLGLLSIPIEDGLIISATRPGHQVGLTPKQANLIASAPDLYEALKTLLEKYWMNKETDGLNGFIACITPEGIPEYWQVADKALAKAEGK